MPRRVPHPSLAVLAAVVLLTGPATASAGWGADRAQTRTGTAGGVRAAGGSGDRVALSWQRRIASTQRAELRLGRARDGLTRAPLVLDSSPNSVETPITTYVRDGAFAVAWRRFLGQNHRIRVATVDRNGRRGATINATTTGESAYDPQWVAGPVPALAWSRRTRADAIELTPTGLRGVRLPVSPLSEPGATTDANGLATVSWVNERERRVLVSDRGPGGFGPPATVATGDVSLTRVIRARGGATLVFWRQDADLMVAARPAGGSFGAARRVLANTADAAQVALTGTGEVLVVAPTGDSSLVGDLQLARLGADGAPLGSTLALGRGRRAVLAADGTGSAFVAWMGESSARAITARRIAPGGILGVSRLLAARSDPTSSPTLAATREGGAVAAWVAGGDVHARTYRP